MHSSDHGDVYAALRSRVAALVRAADARVIDAVVAATPDWRVRDLVAHMVGVTADVVNGRLDGVASDAWTARQVDERAEANLDHLLREWDEHAPAFDAVLRDLPDAVSGQAIFDAATHEHDLRHALGAPGARDSDAVGVAWDWIAGARAGFGATSVRIVADGEDALVVGAGEPVATVRASRFELFRAMTGRRTAAEISAYDWDRAPDPKWLLAAPVFTLRAESLGE